MDIIGCPYPRTVPVPYLPAGTVHVWCATLEPTPERLAVWEPSLSVDEIDRAARFHFHRHRQRFVAAHAILRDLLGHYLDQAPGDVKISYSKYNKPYLENSHLNFNLSHSAEVALFAFCWDGDLGVDVEKIRAVKDAGSIAARFFAPAEYEQYQLLPEEERQEAFFTCWTRKEAFIKAVGEGLSYPLDAFEVAFGRGREVKLRRINGREEEAQNWSLYDLSPLAGYASALAVKGRGWQRCCYQYVPESGQI